MLKYRRSIVLLLALTALAAETKPERTDRYGDPLPKGAVARMGTVRLRQYRVTQVAFSSCGKFLASSGQDGMVRVWDAVTQKEMHVFAAQQDEHGCFAFAPDGKVLVAGGKDRTIRFWDVTAGKQFHAFAVPDVVHKIAYSPNGKTVATIAGKSVHLWDCATGKKILTITLPQKSYDALAFSPDGKTLATEGTGLGETVSLWDAATGKPLRTFQDPKTEQITSVPVYSVAFSQDGKRLASSGEKSVRVWEVASGKQLCVFKPDCMSWCVVFAPDGKAVASVGYEKQIHCWEVDGGKEIRHYDLPDLGGVSLAFSPDGKMLAMGHTDRVHLWDARTVQPIHDRRGHSSLVSSLAYSPDGKHLASGSDDKTVRLWDVDTGQELRIFRGHQGGVSTVSFRPDGQTLASGGRDNTLRLWQVASGKTFWTQQGNNWILSLAYSPDGKRLATGEIYGGFTPLRIWNLDTRKEMPVSLKHSDSLDSVAFSPDGKQLLASGGLDREIHLWDVETGKVLRVFSGHQRNVNSVAFSPDGRYITSGSHDNTARLWNAASGQQIHILRHREIVFSVAFSPDGMLLASGGWGQTVHLWDVLTGKELHVFRGHRGAVFSVSFSPDGRTLASGSRDTSCLVWDVAAPFQSDTTSADRLSDRQRESLWAALGGSDTLAAWRAVYALAAESDRIVPFLDQHLQKPIVNPKQVQHWIGDLESDTFIVREKAQKELQQKGEAVEPALHQALQNRPSLELHKRVERLLAGVATTVPSGEYLASLRALTVLERIGTPAARKVLERLAQESPLDRRTRFARAALLRLDARYRMAP